mgnify:FL=1
MDYLISFVAEQTQDLMGEEYPFVRFYAADDKNLPAILDEPYTVALDYAKARGEIPVRVNIRQYVPEFENGEALLYSIYSLYREGYVCVKLLQISTEEEIELDELPCGSGKFDPVFHGDWNVIYQNIHYREDFLSVYERFLMGTDPPIRADADLSHGG